MLLQLLTIKVIATVIAIEKNYYNYPINDLCRDGKSWLNLID